MKEYYFDNSATSSPKPEEVYKSVDKALRELNGNPGRAGHRKAIKINREIYSVREKISNFFNIKNPMQVAFTANATESLNFAIKGAIKKDSHVITTKFEHNSVLRPLYSLVDEGKIELDFVVTYEEIEKKIKKETKAIVINHISNVNGTVQDIKKIGEICKKNNILFILDASQSAGYRNIDMKEHNIDILCATGHKSLFGIQGIGIICVREGIEIEPILEGGTGSYSKEKRQPKEMPELLESGTLNTPGILSLGAGIDFINKITREEIENHENRLVNYFLDELEKIDEIEVYKSLTKEQGQVVSINLKGIFSEDLSVVLDEEFGILVRAGFHCAPLAHEVIGTYETGAVRFSFGYFNLMDEIDYIIKSLKKIIKEI